MWAGKWCITFWVMMKKHGEISTYFRLKNHCGKEGGRFFCAVHPNKKHMTTHPVQSPDYFYHGSNQDEP